MAVSLSNRKRIKRQKGPLPKKNATAPNKRRPLAPVRQRRGGGRYADTTSRASNGDGGMALLNAVRSQGKLEALHDQNLKTIGNLEMRVGKAEATLRHKLDGHRVERDGDIGMRGMPPTVPLHDDDGASHSPAPPTTKTDSTEMGTPYMPTPSPMGGTAASFCVAQRRRTEFLCSEKEGTARGTRGRFFRCVGSTVTSQKSTT